MANVNVSTVNVPSNPTGNATVSASDALLAKLNAMEAANAELSRKLALAEAKQAARITVKIAEYGSGAVSLYGIGRFPVSFYPNQWQAIFDQKTTIEAFTAANQNELRSASFAHEFANKAYKARFSNDYPKNPKDTDQAFFQDAWKTGYTASMGDTSMISTRMAKSIK